MRALTMSTTASWVSIVCPARFRTDQLTGRLQAGTANKEAVNIGLLGKLAAVLLADGATVDDTDLVLGLGGDGLAEPFADSGVDLLGLLGGSDLAGTDSPGK
jgi:hypothetical protein